MIRPYSNLSLSAGAFFGSLRYEPAVLATTSLNMGSPLSISMTFSGLSLDQTSMILLMVEVVSVRP
jgi:hypothetical protein